MRSSLTAAVKSQAPKRELVVLGSLLIGFALFFTAFFAPVLFSGSYMTSGDGLLQALPTYLGRNPLWEPNMMLGYPLFADPNQAYWYPLLRVLRSLPVPLSFNAYAAAPYVIAAFGTAAFARRASGSMAGGIVAGLVFSLGGFMISHQGHLNLLHSAAWTPYVLWAIEETRRRPSFVPVAAGAFALALSALGGAQQPLVYVGLIGIAYAIVFAGPEAQCRNRTLRAVALMFVLGVGLSAIALLPAAELARASSRAHESFPEFIVFSTNPAEFALRSTFPYFFGATASPLYPWSRDVLGAFSEASNYAGILPLMLGVVALSQRAQRRHVFFWVAAAIWAAWMAGGDALFGARIAYLLPIYGMFRIPGRHAVEFTLAIAVLASFGVSAIECGLVPTRTIVLAVAVLGSLFVTLLGSVAFRGDALRTGVNNAVAAPSVPLLPWQNPSLGIPCALFVIGALALIVWTRLPNRRIANAFGILAVAFDLWTFAGSAYWRWSTVPLAGTRPSALAEDLRGRLAAEQGRMLATLGARLPQSIPPNLSVLWALPSAGGYVSLELRAVQDVLAMEGSGEVPERALGVFGDKALDLVGARYLLMPPETNARRPLAEEFSGESLDGFIGADPITADKTLLYGFATPQPATAIDLVSALGLSTTIPNNAVVARLTIVDAANHSFAIPIVAGKDTSESAFDRPDVHPLVRHAKARVFSGDATAQLYVARFRVPTGLPIRRLGIRWEYADRAAGALSVVHLALVDERGKTAFPVTPIARFYAEPQHWQMESFGSDVLIHNRRALPNAWIVGTVRLSPGDRAVAAIKHDRLPGAEPFDPRSEALTANPTHTFLAPDNAAAGSVRSLAATPTTERFDVTCRARCLLVINGAWYPGWRAAVDGRSADTLKVDAVLRGVDVTAGHHVVETWFAPASLAVGVALTSLSALLVGFRLAYPKAWLGRR